MYGVYQIVMDEVHLMRQRSWSDRLDTLSTLGSGQSPVRKVGNQMSI